MNLNIAGRKREVEVECRQENWADEEGRKPSIHDYETRSWRHLDAFEFETIITARVPRVRISMRRQGAEEPRLLMLEVKKMMLMEVPPVAGAPC